MAKKDTYSGEERIKLNPPLGSQDLRVVSIIDCGTQPGLNPSWEAKPKLIYNFELVNTNADFGDGVLKPFHRSMSFNPYLGTKKDGSPTKYKAFLQKLLGRAIQKGEAIPREKLVNKACRGLFVEEDDFKAHEELVKANPNVAANTIAIPKKVVFHSISSVSAEEGKTFASVRNPLIYFELPSAEDPTPECYYKMPDEDVEVLTWVECFNNLPKWMQKEIMRSKEAQTAMLKDGLTYDEKAENDTLTYKRKAQARVASGQQSFGAENDAEDTGVADDRPF